MGQKIEEDVEGLGYPNYNEYTHELIGPLDGGGPDERCIARDFNPELADVEEIEVREFSGREEAEGGISRHRTRDGKIAVRMQCMGCGKSWYEVREG